MAVFANHARQDACVLPWVIFTPLQVLSLQRSERVSTLPVWVLRIIPEVGGASFGAAERLLAKAN